MRVPINASTDVQQAFREVWQLLDTFFGSQNFDMAGRRIVNAGKSVGARDYVTKQELTGGSGSTALDPLVVDNATVRKALLVENLLRFRTAAFNNPAAGIVQLTKGDGTTLGSFKLLTLLLSGHVQITSAADDHVDVKDHTGAGYATIEALQFQPSTRQTYTPTTVSTLRGGDFSSLSTDDVRSILGTLITDLQAAGLLG